MPHYRGTAIEKEIKRMSKEIISTDKAPAAIGPYVQAVKSHGILFISGQLGFNMEDGSIP